MAEEKQYPFRGYPQRVNDDDGTLVEVRVSPRVHVAPGKKDDHSVSIYIDGGESLSNVIATCGNLTVIAKSKKDDEETRVDQLVDGCANAVIGWIEGGFDYIHASIEVAFKLIDILASIRKAKDFKRGYVTDRVRMGDLAGTINLKYSHEELVNDVLSHLDENDRLTFANAIPPAIDGWKIHDAAVAIEVFDKLDAPQESWNDLMTAVFALPGINANTTGDIIKKHASQFFAWLSTIDAASRNDISKRIIEKSEHRAGDKERDAEKIATDIFRADPSIIEEHYSRALDRSFSDVIASGFISFARIHGAGEAVKEKYKRYIAQNIDKARSSEELSKNLADMLNIIPGVIDPSSFRSVFSAGIEIEQCSAKADDDNEEISAGTCKGVIVNPNPMDLPVTLPDKLIERTRSSCGHWDASTPWEWTIDHTTNFETIASKFASTVGKSRWAWHKNIETVYGTVGCSSHVHFSPTRSGNSAWQLLWNDLVVLLPLTAPMWIFGQRPRVDAFRWSAPVIDTFNADEIKKLIDGNVVKGKSGHHYQASHQYDALAWNKHGSKDITIEFRLNESHPFWAARSLEMLNSVIISLGDSAIAIENQDDVLSAIWEHLRTEDVYAALSHSGTVKFIVKPPVLPKYEYDSALDAFIDICTSYASSVSKVASKVAELYAKLVNIDNVDADLVWDIDELHRLVFDDKDADKNQAAFLYNA